MKIRFNSEIIEVTDGISVSDLKKSLLLPESGMAVAVNGKIVPLSHHSEYILCEDDEVLAIRAAYGG